MCVYFAFVVLTSFFLAKKYNYLIFYYWYLNYLKYNHLHQGPLWSPLNYLNRHFNNYHLQSHFLLHIILSDICLALLQFISLWLIILKRFLVNWKILVFLLFFLVMKWTFYEWLNIEKNNNFRGYFKLT